MDFTIENAIAKPSALRVKAALKDKVFVLASSSPRRRQVLELLGLKFRIQHPVVNESSSSDIDAARFAESIAASKVETVRSQFPGSIIIGADTVVVLGNQILGKPENVEDAFEALRLLRGKEHRVITAISACGNGERRSVCSHEVTRVIFRDYSEAELESYIASGESMDKAGSYGIQGMGSVLVERIEGELDNVIGLPLDCLAKVLDRISYVGNRI